MTSGNRTYLLRHLPRVAQWLVVALVVLMPLWAMAQTAGSGLPADNSPIGEAARANAEQYAGKPVPGAEAPANDLGTLYAFVGLLLLLAFILVTVLFNYVSRLTGFEPFKSWNSNVINPRLLVAFLVVSAIALYIEHSAYAKFTLIGDPASEHGAEIDRMMTNTLIITFIVFVITQSLLFIFSYIYRGRPGRIASYYHDNSRLEIAWTLIPAVALSYLVLDGVSVWQKIHERPNKNPIQVELVAEQFQWNIRYAGADNALGNANYKLIVGENNLGVDWKDATSHDDLYAPEKVLVVPVDQPVRVNIRAKDVLHGVYMPHFRVQMYAVPGMPTQFEFVPKVTTAQARQEANNPDFNYEMACSQLCGSGHYNMRVVIQVVSQEEYQKYLQGIQPMYAQLRERGSIQDQPATIEGTTNENDRPSQPNGGPEPQTVTPGGERPATLR